jgi:hypothetical protein
LRIRPRGLLCLPLSTGRACVQGLWYGDRRDRVKWGALAHLVRRFGLASILQIAYFRDGAARLLRTDQGECPIADEVWKHFADLAAIERLSDALGVQVRVYGDVFDPKNREQYFPGCAHRRRTEPSAAAPLPRSRHRHRAGRPSSRARLGQRSRTPVERPGTGRGAGRVPARCAPSGLGRKERRPHGKGLPARAGEVNPRHGGGGRCDLVGAKE